MDLKQDVVKPVDDHPHHPVHPLEGWRSFVAGLVAVGIGCYDVWRLGHNEGLTVEVDEILILVGIGLIASMPNVFLNAMLGGRRNENGHGKTPEESKPPIEKP